MATGLGRAAAVMASLTAPLRLASPTELRFWASTEASDMAWVARLADVVATAGLWGPSVPR